MRRWVTLYGFLTLLSFLGGGCDGSSTTESPNERGVKTEALAGPVTSPGHMENNEGVAHYSKGRWDMAEVHFRKSLDVDPGLAEGHFNLGLVLDKKGQHQKATQSFAKALELAPEDPKIAASPILQSHVKP